jgi:hypothetical protein
VAGELYLNAINVMRGAEGLSTYTPIDESEKFKIEYWAREEAKLQRMPKPKPPATRIALVTGAASGIGNAISMLPDLLGFWVTGEQIGERTNASTTGLLEIGSRTWNATLIDQLSCRARCSFPRRSGPVSAPCATT